MLPEKSWQERNQIFIRLQVSGLKTDLDEVEGITLFGIPLKDGSDPFT